MVADEKGNPAITFLLGALFLVFVWLGVSFARSASGAAHAYTLSQLARLPHMMPGQTFALRGYLTAYTAGPHRHVFELTDTPRIMDGTQELDVAPGPANPALDGLHLIPYVGALIPPSAAHPITGRLTTYRVLFVGCAKPALCTSPPPWKLVSGG